METYKSYGFFKGSAFITEIKLRRAIKNGRAQCCLSDQINQLKIGEIDAKRGIG
jgi:hypothetical protein